jgi:hypothetical protein
MRFLRISLVIFAIFLATPIVAFFAYDLFCFQPYSAQIKTIIANAPPEDRKPPLLVTELIRVSEPQGIDQHLSRILFYRFKASPSHSNPGNRITQQLMWEQMIRLHLTEQERMSLYCSLVYSGKNEPGLSAASARLFNKRLSELSAPEAATVVALLQGPGYYERSQERLFKRRDLLLQRLGVGL